MSDFDDNFPKGTRLSSHSQLRFHPLFFTSTALTRTHTARKQTEKSQENGLLTLRWKLFLRLLPWCLAETQGNSGSWLTQRKNNQDGTSSVIK